MRFRVPWVVVMLVVLDGAGMAPARAALPNQVRSSVAAPSAGEDSGSVAAAASGGLTHAARRGFAGTAVAVVDCFQIGYACALPVSPFTLAIEAAEGSGVQNVQFCDFNRSWCMLSSYFTAKQLECWRVVPGRATAPALTGATWYGSASSRNGSTSATEWWTFKVVDAGPGGVDRIGMGKSDSLVNDGACGARKLRTTPVIAGDFHSFEIPVWKG